MPLRSSARRSCTQVYGRNVCSGLRNSMSVLVTLSFTWQDSTCSRSRRYSRRHWQQPSDSWEISGMVYKLKGLYLEAVHVNTALHHCWKRILLISSKRYPGQGASSSAVAFIRVGTCRNSRRWKKMIQQQQPKHPRRAQNKPQHTTLSSNLTHRVRP